MDTNELFQGVYTGIKKKSKKAKIDPSTLTFEANIALMNLRDAWIAEQAAAVLQVATPEMLDAIKETIYQKVFALDESYALSLHEAWDDEVNDTAELLAYTLAVIKWYTQPPFTLREVYPEDAYQWLQTQTAEPVQLALF